MSDVWAMAAERRGAAQTIQLDEEGESADDAAQVFDELDRRRGRAPGGEHIIHDQHPHAVMDRVGVDLEHRFAVLQCVRHGHRGRGQASLFADRNEPGAEQVGNGGGKDETARLDARDDVHLDLSVRRGHGVDGLVERRSVARAGW